MFNQHLHWARFEVVVLKAFIAYWEEISPSEDYNICYDVGIYRDLWEHKEQITQPDLEAWGGLPE